MKHILKISPFEKEIANKSKMEKFSLNDFDHKNHLKMRCVSSLWNKTPPNRIEFYMNECNLYVYTKSVLSDLSCRLNVFEPHIHAHSIWKSDDGIASKHIFSDLHVLPRNALASSETKKKKHKTTTSKSHIICLMLV